MCEHKKEVKAGGLVPFSIQRPADSSYTNNETFYHKRALILLLGDALTKHSHFISIILRIQAHDHPSYLFDTPKKNTVVQVIFLIHKNIFRYSIETEFKSR